MKIGDVYKIKVVRIPIYQPIGYYPANTETTKTITIKDRIKGGPIIVSVKEFNKPRNTAYITIKNGKWLTLNRPKGKWEIISKEKIN